MLVFCDSFAPYGGNTAWMSQRWTQIAGVAVGTAYGIAGRSGVNFFSNGGINKTLVPSDTWILGFRYQINLGGPGFGALAYQLSAVSIGRGLATLAQLAVMPDGTLAVYAGNNQLIFNPSSFVFTSGNAYYIELKLELTGSGSSAVHVVATLRVNGVQIATGNKDANVTCDFLLSGQAKGDFHTFSTGTTGGSTYLSDLYILDETGTTNNDFLGDVAVGAIYPRADATVTGYLPSTGATLFNLINERPPDADGTYIYSHTVGDVGECFFDTVASFTGQILGVQFSIVARKDDEGVRAFKHAVGPAAAYVDVNDTYISDDYRYYHVPFDVDPNGPVPWTVTVINGEQFGIKTTV